MVNFLTGCTMINLFFRLEESSRSVAIRTNGHIISKYTQMKWETTRVMQFCPMKIHPLHILLVDFTTVFAED